MAWGCLDVTNRRFPLESAVAGYIQLSLFRLAGPFAAYQREECPAACGISLRIFDLRSGAEAPEIFDLAEHHDPSGFPQAYATDLALKDNGSLAWIMRAGQESVEVRARDAAGLRTLDAGAGIQGKSLRLDGSTLTWVKDGTIRSATLQ